MYKINGLPYLRIDNIMELSIYLILHTIVNAQCSLPKNIRECRNRFRVAYDFVEQFETKYPKEDMVILKQSALFVQSWSADVLVCDNYANK